MSFLLFFAASSRLRKRRRRLRRTIAGSVFKAADRLRTLQPIRDREKPNLNSFSKPATTISSARRAWSSVLTASCSPPALIAATRSSSGKLRPIANENYTILLVNAPAIKDKNGSLTRPTTDSTLQHFIEIALVHGSCLVISNNPYIKRQTAVAQRILPQQHFPVEGAGPAINEKSFDYSHRNR